MNQNQILELSIGELCLKSGVENSTIALPNLLRLCGFLSPHRTLDNVTVRDLIESLRGKSAELLHADVENRDRRVSVTILARVFFESLCKFDVKPEDLDLPQILLEALPEKPGKTDAIERAFAESSSGGAGVI